MNWGVIGNCQSAALVDDRGSIVWCCLPEFDSASVFAKILDEEKGGEFAVKVGEEYTVTQRYLKNTNILFTRYEEGNNVFELFDFMPRYKTERGSYHCPPDIIRYIKHISGNPKATFVYSPRLGYAHYATCSDNEGEFIKSSVKEGVYESVYLYTSFSNDKILNAQEVEISKDNYFVLSYNQKILDLDVRSVWLEFQRTRLYWLEWIYQTVHYSAYTEEVHRSALVLKLLSYQKSGAILAAVTTSLPETVGEERNWDYRFCWIRDSSMIVTILTKLGHYNVAKRFVQFVLNAIPHKDTKCQIMYSIRGEKDLEEKQLDWLSGYKNSKPVRVGNAAFVQKQNDIYGVLLDVMLKFIQEFKTDVENLEGIWTICRSLIRRVGEHWSEADMGIWEFRNQKQHFVFSKVLCWVALDRGVKIAKLLHKNDYIDEWGKIRDEIKQDILEKGWNPAVGSFVQYYGAEDMDASNLLMANYEFLDPKDPMFVKTVLKTKEELCRDDLMYRYKNRDDFGLPSSSFTICSFWLVKSLCQIGEKNEAKRIFDKLLKSSNHLGLFSEDVDFESKNLLGNFPQGYSHLALIDCAITLGEMAIEGDSELIELMEGNNGSND